ncbi:uncharacterized protein Dvir_GJ25729 [Drosophila virilis]|uniref:Uncharacterized protein n=1 Tax=Drosophila virilis TaxID=7244 RepID=A0A0Q9WEH5_DROVI|nr:uncharacterized protein Dvir_GJ25729 [Drosophila virilis]
MLNDISSLIQGRVNENHCEGQKLSSISPSYTHLTFFGRRQSEHLRNIIMASCNNLWTSTAFACRFNNGYAQDVVASHG